MASMMNEIAPTDEARKQMQESTKLRDELPGNLITIVSITLLKPINVLCPRDQCQKEKVELGTFILLLLESRGGQPALPLLLMNISTCWNKWLCHFITSTGESSDFKGKKKKKKKPTHH